MASEYSNYTDNYLDNEWKSAKDFQGVTWEYSMRNDGTICLWGTLDISETMIIPSELEGHKVVTIGRLVKDVNRFSPEYEEYQKKCDSIKKDSDS